MDKPTVERCIETKFFKKHKKHISAVLNLKKQEDNNEEISKDLTAKRE